MNKILTAITFLLFACATCFGQSSFYELTPGKNTRADVEKLLGQPVHKVSETLIEYAALPSTKKIYVEYRKNSPIVERIEVFLADPVSRSDAIRLFRLPKKSSGGRTNAKGRIEEYFGSPIYIVLTYEGDTVSSMVSSLGYYSRELFESAIRDNTRD